jgi:hypothetical protein
MEGRGGEGTKEGRTEQRQEDEGRKGQRQEEKK